MASRIVAPGGASPASPSENGFTKCEPGVVARIVDPGPVRAIGAIVQVKRAATLEEFAYIVSHGAEDYSRNVWCCTAVTGIPGISNGEDPKYYALPGALVWLPDLWLEPIVDDGQMAEDTCSAAEVNHG